MNACAHRDGSQAKRRSGKVAQRATAAGRVANGLTSKRGLMFSSQGSFSKARVEAFSDGVMAVVITIMVLDLKAPRSGEPAALVRLWPSFAIYLVSFVLTTIYWINHHGLIAQARHVTPGLLWANSGLLFFASLIPFATAYVAETRLAPLPTAVYAGLQCLCGVAFNLLFAAIVQQRDDAAFLRRARLRRRQNLVAVAVYALSAMVALVSPIVAVLLFCFGLACVRRAHFLGEEGRLTLLLGSQPIAALVTAIDPA